MEFNSYSKTKKMPPLKDIAKKLQPEDFGIGTEPSKGKGKRTHEQGEGLSQLPGVGASAKPEPQKRVARRSLQVKLHLQHEDEEIQEQKEEENEEEKDEKEKDKGNPGEEDDEDDGKRDEEEGQGKHDKPDHSDTGEIAAPLPKPTSSDIARFLHIHDSESSTLRSEGSSRNVSHTGDQPRAHATSSRKEELRAGDSDPQTGSSSHSNKVPPTGFTPTNKNVRHRTLGSSG